MLQYLSTTAIELISVPLKASKQAEPLLPPPLRTSEPGQPNPKGNKRAKWEGLSRP
jgi:hypothetical protein